MTDTSVIKKLSPRQGKVLRYVCCKSRNDVIVTPEMCIVHIAWSDMPHTAMQARSALVSLRKVGLVERVDKDQYRATEDGFAVMKEADKRKLWRKAPPPSVTNVRQNRSKVS
jgi:RIO-like serine/threonine protein kinase